MPTGRTLRRWKDAFLAYFTTGRANNGGTEAVNGITGLEGAQLRALSVAPNGRFLFLQGPRGAWVAGEDDVMGEERKPLTGAAAAVYEIVMRDEEYADEDRAR